jgi:Ca2+-binding EF-hand superfamily protein
MGEVVCQSECEKISFFSRRRLGNTTRITQRTEQSSYISASDERYRTELDKLKMQEIKKTIRKRYSNNADEIFQRWTEDYDIDNSETLELAEFLEILWHEIDYSYYQLRMGELKYLYETFDGDNDGSIRADEFSADFYTFDRYCDKKNEGRMVTQATEYCRGNLKKVLLLVPPEEGFAKKDLSDTHCWANYINGPGIEGERNSSGRPLAVFVLVIYTTGLGFFLALQELFNLAPAGHHFSRCVVKERLCIGGFSFLCNNRCSFISMLFAEIFYYVAFISGYNVCLAMFLSPGEDLTGYDKKVVEDMGYRGARLWESTVDTEISILIGYIALSFVYVIGIEAVHLCLCKTVNNKLPVRSKREGKKRIDAGRSCVREQAILIVLIMRGSSFSLFGFFFFQLSFLLVKKQIEALNGIALVVPVNFRMLHVNFSMLLTVSFSFSMAISRFASMFFNSASRFSRFAGKRLRSIKKMKSSRKILLHQPNSGSVVQETAKETAKEQIIKKSVKAADQKLLEQQEKQNKKAVELQVENFGETTTKTTRQKLRGKTKVIPSLHSNSVNRCSL